MFYFFILGTNKSDIEACVLQLFGLLSHVSYPQIHTCEEPPFNMLVFIFMFLFLFVVSGLANTFTQYQETLLFILSFCLLLPALSTELFCSLSIISCLRKSGPGVKGLQRKTEGNQQKLRAVKIICIVLAMLIFNVVPFIVLSSFFICVKKDLLPLAFTLATTGSPIQAFLFLSRSWKGQLNNPV